MSGPDVSDFPGSKRIEIPLRNDLADGTYTVRYKLSGRRAIIPASTSCRGTGPVGPPFLAGSGNAGPSPTSGWGVSARFFELVGLGGLLGLIAFRWIVWGPIWRGANASAHFRRRARDRAVVEPDLYWVVFGAMAVGAMLAEGFLLITYSASALGAGVLDTLRNTTGIGDVLASTQVRLARAAARSPFVRGLRAGGMAVLTEFGSAANRSRRRRPDAPYRPR